MSTEALKTALEGLARKSVPERKEWIKSAPILERARALAFTQVQKAWKQHQVAEYFGIFPSEESGYRKVLKLHPHIQGWIEADGKEIVTPSFISFFALLSLEMQEIAFLRFKEAPPALAMREKMAWLRREINIYREPLKGRKVAEALFAQAERLVDALIAASKNHDLKEELHTLMRKLIEADANIDLRENTQKPISHTALNGTATADHRAVKEEPVQKPAPIPTPVRRVAPLPPVAEVREHTGARLQQLRRGRESDIPPPSAITSSRTGMPDKPLVVTRLRSNGHDNAPAAGPKKDTPPERQFTVQYYDPKYARVVMDVVSLERLASLWQGEEVEGYGSLRQLEFVRNGTEKPGSLPSREEIERDVAALIEAREEAERIFWEDEEDDAPVSDARF